MNKIQKQILSKLYTSKSLKFSETKPDGIESDLFNYHLKHLVKRGLVSKSNSRYSLSFAGKKFYAETNPMDINGIDQDVYKLNVLTGAIRKSEDKIEVLIEERKRHPFFNKLSIMGGNIKKGEQIEMAAKRIFTAHTDLVGEFKHVGIVRKIILDNNLEIFTDILFFICFTQDPKGELLEKSKYGVCKWVGIDEAISRESKVEYIKQIYETLKTNQLPDIPLFYHEERQRVANV